MAVGLGRRAGGILGLVTSVLNKPDVRKALQYDLLIRGLSLENLGTEAFTWYDLLVMVRYLQGDSDSRLSAELHGPTWSVRDQLLAQITDLLALANWQRAGRKHSPRPKPVPRPWIKPKVQTVGSDPIPISQFASWWDSKAKPKPKTRRTRRAKKPPTP